MTVQLGETLYARDLPSQRAMRASIRAVWARSTSEERRQGRVWYASAREHAACIADLAGLTPEHGAGILAALSPQLEWGRNIEEAYRLTVAWVDGDTSVLDTLTAYPANVDKASRILAGEHPDVVLGGPKVTAFYQAIAGLPGGPVVDRHATRVATRGRYTAVTRSTYDAVQRAYVAVADRLGVDVHTLQAATWLTCKRELKGS
jgi:hypothetical protein